MWHPYCNALVSVFNITPIQKWELRLGHRRYKQSAPLSLELCGSSLPQNHAALFAWVCPLYFSQPCAPWVGTVSNLLNSNLLPQNPVQCAWVCLPTHSFNFSGFPLPVSQSVFVYPPSCSVVGLPTFSPIEVHGSGQQCHLCLGSCDWALRFIYLSGHWQGFLGLRVYPSFFGEF